MHLNKLRVPASTSKPFMFYQKLEELRELLENSLSSILCT